LPHCGKIPGKSNLREERYILAHCCNPSLKPFQAGWRVISLGNSNNALRNNGIYTHWLASPLLLLFHLGPLATGKNITDKIPQFLHLTGNKFKQDTKIIVKVIVNFIRKGIHFQQTESGLPQERKQPSRF
jgi:hypothetical protein